MHVSVKKASGILRNSDTQSISPLSLLILLLLLLIPSLANAEFVFTDRNEDLVADVPIAEDKWVNPEVLTFCIVPETDGKDYDERYKPLANHIAAVTGRKVEHLMLGSSTEQIMAMSDGRLHIAGFSTGTTVFAVNLTGYIPVAAKGKDNELNGYQMQVITESATDNYILPDLKGKRIAHSTPTSNSGNLAPRALLPELGLTPEKDYEVLFSGSHRESILGVANGLYDGAAIASSVLYRMLKNGEVNNKDIRILYSSPTFPTLSIGYAHNLHPELAANITKALTTYLIPPQLHKHYKGADRLVPISYKKDWEIVRFIANASGVEYTKKALLEMKKK
ncbi:MAG: phosphate/phosphite/phosphonate ABC transporter substrate-binding protein [Desulfocapsa sp.]|nr:phosphate/phosphite/phosphonate ABC transporter substrate-binding protein [Desulfocapsa sp.]